MLALEMCNENDVAMIIFQHSIEGLKDSCP